MNILIGRLKPAFVSADQNELPQAYVLSADSLSSLSSDQCPTLSPASAGAQPLATSDDLLVIHWQAAMRQQARQSAAEVI